MIQPWRWCDFVQTCVGWATKLMGSLEICSFDPDESVFIHVFPQHFQANSSGSVVRSENITRRNKVNCDSPYYAWTWILNVLRHRKLNQPGRPTSHADANDRLCLWNRSLNPISVFAIRRYIALKHGKTRCFITQGFQATATKSTSHWQQILPTMWGPNVMWTLVSNHPMNTRALFAYHQHNNNEFLQFCKPQPLASVFAYRTVMARNTSYGYYLIAKLSWGYHSMDIWLTYNSFQIWIFAWLITEI
jgi:hypothetical protein